MDPKLIKAALDALVADDAEAAKQILQELLVNAAGGDADAPDDAPEGEALADEPSEPDPEEEMAKTALKRLSGRESVADAAALLEGVVKRVHEADAQAAQLEASERRDLVGRLVKCGVELPATAWANTESREPVQRLKDEPLAELRSRVNLHEKQRRAEPTAPREATPDITQLGDDELRRCKAKGMDPVEYLRRKAAAVRSA